jgi:hypothetical protein
MTTDDLAEAERRPLADKFLGYTAALLPTYLHHAPDAVRHVRIPHAYALMTAMNAFLANEGFEATQTEVRRPSWRSRKEFANSVELRKLWVWGDPLLKKTIDDFRKLKFLNDAGNFRITTKGVQLLVDHAERAYGFFCGPETVTSNRSPLQWIKLNREIFEQFSESAYGETWTILRDGVNKAIMKKRGRENAIDPLSMNTTYWIVYNLVLVRGQIDDLAVPETIRAYGLQRLAPSGNATNRAIKELCDSHVIARTNHDVALHIPPAYEVRVSNLLVAMRETPRR